MPAQSIKVTPPALLAAAASVAATAEKAAAPPTVAPHAVPGSPADGAWSTIAAGMATQSAQLSADVAGKGPEVTATTSAGVAQLEGQDADNAAQIQAVGDAAVTQSAQPGAGGAPALSNPFQAAAFKSTTIIGDDWDEDEWGVWHPPYHVPDPIGGAEGGHTGMGTAPI